MDLSIYFTFEKMAYLYRTPPSSPDAEKRKTVCPWAPNREGNSNKIIISIPFPMIYQKNRFSTPLKRRHVNRDVPCAPIKSQRKSLLQTTLDDFRKELFCPNFSASLRERINDKRKLKDIGAPMKIGIKKNLNKRDLNSTKKNLFENKEIFSPYSRTLSK